MFIKLFLIGIILYIIINQLTDNKLLSADKTQSLQIIKEEPPVIIPPPNMQMNQSTRLQHDVDIIQQPPQQNIQPRVEKMSNNKIHEFDNPRPWTKVVIVEEDEFPFYFHFKVVIPSLNDFERWKEIIPNLDFNPNTREMIIPCKEEASALAVANLICINFSGQMTMQNILNKDLIRISIHKARTHEVVRNKLREQIMDVLHGKSSSNIPTNYEEDLAKNNSGNNNSGRNAVTSLKSENFRDTFEHFSDNRDNGNEISAYDSSSYSYI
jgi:hypothetical protein